MLWPKASPLDLDFGLCAWAKLFNNTSTLETHASLHMKKVQKIAVFSYNVLLKSSSGFVHIIAVFTFII